VTAAVGIFPPGRKVRAPPDRVLGNSQASEAAWPLPQGTESGTETYRLRHEPGLAIPRNGRPIDGGKVEIGR